MSARSRPLWKCPRCGRRFANRNQWHSCRRFTVRDHLAGKNPAVIDLYRRFVAAVRNCGPVTLAPTKTRIGVKTRMTFAAVVLKKRWLDAHIILPQRADDPLFRRVESITPGCHVHHFRIVSADQIDDDLRRWLREAYGVGRQEHLP